MPGAPDLLESLLWEPEGGFFLLDEHLARIRRSARHLGYPFSEADARAALGLVASGLRAAAKVRLLSGSGGAVRVEAEALGLHAEPVRVRIADEPVDSRDPRLRHKTDDRGVYARRLAAHPGFDDVLLVNERGEVTESTVANVVVRSDGELWTPPVSAGLLPGVFRAALLAGGEIRERAIPAEEVLGAEAVYLVNSVRRWRTAEVVA